MSNPASSLQRWLARLARTDSSDEPEEEIEALDRTAAEVRMIVHKAPG